jgi:putative membrane protein
MGVVAVRRLIARISLAALAAMNAGSALAHEVAGSRRPAAQLELRWSAEPWVIACLALSLLAYAIGVARLWSHAGRGRGIGMAPVAAFGAGWLLLFVALVSPLDALGGQLFSAHMLQHELLMVVVAPLMVVGRPLAAWAWALPPAARRGAGAVFRHPFWRRPWLWLSAPLGARLIHAAALRLWHVPAWFEAALASDAVHAWQHFGFLFSALLFWWSALGQVSRAAQGTALVFLFTTMMHTGALGALLALSPVAWYPHYLVTTAALGWDAIEDQQLGGLVMWVPAGLAYLGAGLALAWRWLGAPSTLVAVQR